VAATAAVATVTVAAVVGTGATATMTATTMAVGAVMGGAGVPLTVTTGADRVLDPIRE